MKKRHRDGERRIMLGSTNRHNGNTGQSEKPKGDQPKPTAPPLTRTHMLIFVCLPCLGAAGLSLLQSGAASSPRCLSHMQSWQPSCHPTQTGTHMHTRYMHGAYTQRTCTQAYVHTHTQAGSDDEQPLYAAIQGRVQFISKLQEEAGRVTYK